MVTIFEQIDQELTKNLTEVRRHPTCLYLGKRQVEELRTCAKALMGAYPEEMGFSLSGYREYPTIRERYCGMTIYMVDAEDHINFGQ